MPKTRPAKVRQTALGSARASRGVTQAELARRAKMTQSEISRVELRRDCLVSTLQRYATALDGELRLSVQIERTIVPGDAPMSGCRGTQYLSRDAVKTAVP